MHPERLRQLARAGGRYTAQHLRALSPLRRRATLVATVLDTTTRLTDDGIALFDRAVGRLFRRAEAREEATVLRNAQVVNDKLRLFAKLGDALLGAREAGEDPLAAVEAVIGWDRLARSVKEAHRLVRPDKAGLSRARHPGLAVLHGLGPLFLEAFAFVPSPRPAPCGPSKPCTTSIAAAVERGHAACRSPSSNRLAQRGPDAAGVAAGPGRSRCWPCGTGCAPATSGSRAAGSGGPSRTS